MNLKALKDQSTLDFGRSLKSITVNGKVAKVDRSNVADNGKILENAFKNAEIDEETKKLIYKFPGQSTISTSYFLSLLGSMHLRGDYMLMLPFRPGDPRSDSYNITVNSNGSVEVQARYISHVIILKEGNNLPMAIEEVHTFKINKGEDI